MPPSPIRPCRPATIRDAIDANRVDLYLQPIVTLPQRKVRYYEALTRLRTEGGQMLTPAEFLGPAESSGLIARLDHVLLFRCVQVLRRLQQKNRDVGLFCNLSALTLNDPQFFPQMSQSLDANRVLAPALLIEFKQLAWRAMGPLALESLAALREVGFRFGMDQVTDLRIEPRDLADRGIRFVKAPAGLLLGRSGGAGGSGGADIHAEDLAGLLARFVVNLVADRVESEVVDLLDFDVKFGQGFLFSPPRPVRAEALQGFAGPRIRRRPPRASPAQRPALRPIHPRQLRFDLQPRFDRLPLGPIVWPLRCHLLSLHSSTISPASRQAMTRCSATSGAWCTTASPQHLPPATH